VVAAEDCFREILLTHGFKPEDRQGKLHIGYFHPGHPQFGWQLVTGPLFDGLADQARVVQIEFQPDSAVILPAVEDMIADRLGQYEANRRDPSRLHQAKLLFQVAKTIDMDYLRRRIAQESGDVSLLDSWHREN